MISNGGAFTMKFPGQKENCLSAPCADKCLYKEHAFSTCSSPSSTPYSLKCEPRDHSVVNSCILRGEASYSIQSHLHFSLQFITLFGLSLLLVLVAHIEQNDQLTGALFPSATAAPCYHASITSVGLAPAQPITCTLQYYPVFLIQQKYNVTLLPSSRFNWHAERHDIIMLVSLLFVASILQILMCV